MWPESETIFEQIPEQAPRRQWQVREARGTVCRDLDSFMRKTTGAGVRQVSIENPIINSPFVEPERHFRFDDDGITDEMVHGRRDSSYFIPIAGPRKKGKQSAMEGWTADRIEENKTVNFIRDRVRLWREGGYPGVTRVTARLLTHWQADDRHRRLFFCQIEALETVVYIAEVAKTYGDAVIENDLKRFAADANPDLFRVACKMATGSGKTVVMAMMIAWQALNKAAQPRDGHGREDPLQLILEVSGQANKAKVSTAKSLRIPAVNNAGLWGRWAFVEIEDPWDAQRSIRAAIRPEVFV